jgi:anti-anti-sigma factor
MQVIEPSLAIQPPTLLSAPEKLSFDWRHSFRPLLRSVSSNSSVLIDFSHTTSVDTAALGMLLQLEEKLEHNPKRLRLVHVCEELRTLFDVAGLTKYLD